MQRAIMKNYHSMRSFKVITFLSLSDILTLMFNSQHIPVKVILKQAAICVSHSHLFQVISKQAAIMVSHANLWLLSGAWILPHSPKPLFLTFTI